LAVYAYAQPAESGGEGEELSDQPTATAGEKPQQPDGGGTQAEGEPPATTQPQGRPPTGPLGGMQLPLLLLGAFVLIYFWGSRSRRKRDAQRKEMLASLKKGDKVATIGGILGTVITVKEDEVVVKVDETNNVRLRFSRSAIHRVGDAQDQQKS